MSDTGKVNIHGKEYETVASRVQRFRQEYGQEYGIITEIVSIDDKVVVVKASIGKDAAVIATGYAEESRTSSQINRTSALENAETSAIGRALANFGMAGTEYASADEVAQAISQRPPTRAQAKPAPSTNEATPTQKKQIADLLRAFNVKDENMVAVVSTVYGYDLKALTPDQAASLIDRIREEPPEVEG